MRKLLVLLLVAVAVLSGCLLFPDGGSTTSTLVVSGFLSSVPDSYSSGAYSVRGLVHSWSTLGDEEVTVRGVVVSAYSCPPCPPGALCGPCPSPRIALGDPVRGSSVELIVDVGEDYSLARSLSVGEELDVVVKYSSSGGTEAVAVPGVLNYVRLKRTGRRFTL
jgi:hypothetical protein